MFIANSVYYTKPTIHINSYNIVFNKEINYCNELSELFFDIKPMLESKTKIEEQPKDLSITLEHETKLAAEETDLVLLFFTAIYYDCFVNISKNNIAKYIFRVIDGDIKNIQVLN